MERRSLRYTDDKSDKFWNISLTDAVHTVQFGRVGTVGQTQTKSFDSAAAARKSFEKLIRAKLKKGYVEIEAAVGDANTPAIEPSTLEKDQKSSKIEAATSKKVKAEKKDTEAEEVQHSETFEIKRSLNLDPEDWMWATWGERKPSAKPEAQPFDLENCVARLRKVLAEAPDRRRKAAGYFSLDWSKANISVSLSEREATFWLLAMSHVEWSHGCYFNYGSLEKVVSEVSAAISDESFSVSNVRSHLGAKWEVARSEIVIPLYNLGSVLDIAIALQEMDTFSNAVKLIIRGFKLYLWRYLTNSEIEDMRKKLYPSLSIGKYKAKLYPLAAKLGMHEEMKRQVDTWQPNPPTPYYVKTAGGGSLYSTEAMPIILGLGSAALVSASARRLKLLLVNSEHVRGWLACTEYADLDWICYSVIRSYSRGQEPLLKTFAQSVKAPEAAPYILELWLSVKKPQMARQWLEDNLVEAVVGLLPTAAGMSHVPIEVKPTVLTQAAIDFLRSVRRREHEPLLAFALDQVDANIAAKVREIVIDVEDIPCFNAETAPRWLSESISDLTKRKRKNSIDWVSPSDLPDIVVGSDRLNEEQVWHVLTALTLSTLNSPMALIVAVKRQATAESVDSFVWSLFSRWLTDGGEAKGNWAMKALGLMGSDDIALKLTPLIRAWPGESQHGKAKLGLECLRAIGSDTALMQINGIAQKIKYKGLKTRAQECMADIACDRNFTPQQLEDRIIPDCDLDSNGQRVFDFGPRQFSFVLGPDLKPFVRDSKGKLKTTLPKPNQKDDAELAKQAIADWKLMKKQIAAVVKLQADRLEQAMVTERHWPLGDFETLLVRHPLMTHLVQRLVWGAHDSQGKLIATFRVAEDQTLADVTDEAFETTGVESVSVVHPLNLSEKDRADWGCAFSDYEIIPPFAQLHREIYTLTPEEENAQEIKRFAAHTVPGITLARMMEKQGWLKGRLHDHGDYSVHHKYFEQADVTAVVGDYEHQHAQQSSIYGDDAIDGCLFLAGHHPKIYDYPTPGSWYDQQLKAKHQRLGAVSPLVISEVLRDLSAIAATTKSK